MKSLDAADFRSFSDGRHPQTDFARFTQNKQGDIKSSNQLCCNHCVSDPFDVLHSPNVSIMYRHATAQVR